MARVTPPMYSEGVFLLSTPFNAKVDVAYKVNAIRTFAEIGAHGEDPMDLVYIPAGLSRADYQADIDAGAAVITLLSKTEKPIYVPDTYIRSYPNMGSVPYSHLVVSASCGAIADSYDTAMIQTLLQGLLRDRLGITATVFIGRAATANVVSAEEHVEIERARQAAITQTNTDLSRALKAEDTVAAQLVTIAALEQMLQDAGVVQDPAP